MSRELPYVRRFERCGREDVPSVGRKISTLGDLMRSSIPVPPGFAVTVEAYELALAHGGLADRIFADLDPLDVSDLQAVTRISEEVRARIESAPLASEVEDSIRRVYVDLSEQCETPDVVVAIRSSATAEDTPASPASTRASSA